MTLAALAEGFEDLLSVLARIADALERLLQRAEDTEQLEQFRAWQRQGVDP